MNLQPGGSKGSHSFLFLFRFYINITSWIRYSKIDFQTTTKQHRSTQRSNNTRIYKPSRPSSQTVCGLLRINTPSSFSTRPSGYFPQPRKMCYGYHSKTYCNNCSELRRSEEVITSPCRRDCGRLSSNAPTTRRSCNFCSSRACQRIIAERRAEEARRAAEHSRRSGERSRRQSRERSRERGHDSKRKGSREQSRRRDK